MLAAADIGMAIALKHAQDGTRRWPSVPGLAGASGAIVLQTVALRLALIALIVVAVAGLKIAPA